MHSPERLYGDAFGYGREILWPVHSLSVLRGIPAVAGPREKGETHTERRWEIDMILEIIGVIIFLAAMALAICAFGIVVVGAYTNFTRWIDRRDRRSRHERTWDEFNGGYNPKGGDYRERQK